MIQYSVCGIDFLSEIELPLNKSKNDNPNFIFKKSINYPELTFLNESILFQKDSIFIKTKTSNIFEIKRNNEILVYSSDKESRNNIWIEFLGIPLGYALRKSGFTVIHGSSICLNSHAACIIGISGVGKSTLSTGLINEGFSFITEDLCVIKNNEIFQPSSWIKNTNKNMSDLNIDHKQKLCITSDSRKRDLFKLNANQCKNKSIPKAFYFPIDSNKKLINEMKKEDAFKFIFTNFYRMHNNEADNLEKITSLIESVSCYFFSRDINAPIKENAQYLSSHFKDLIKA